MTPPEPLTRASFIPNERLVPELQRIVLGRYFLEYEKSLRVKACRRQNSNGTHRQ